jgi:hypothetical protein
MIRSGSSSLLMESVLLRHGTTERALEKRSERDAQDAGSSNPIDQTLSSQGVAPASEIIERQPAWNVREFLRRATGLLDPVRAGFDFIARRLDAGAESPQIRIAILIFICAHDLSRSK